ncbi:MAG: fructosamine kinase family protein [Thermosynechococcaceae cyanobacterium]
MWQTIEAQIEQVTGNPFSIQNRHSIGGGSINQAYRIRDGSQSYFVKLHQASKIAMFEAEALGLREMAQAKVIRVPQPLCWGTAAEYSYIVLEWLNLGSQANVDWDNMGQRLAAMHRTVSEQGYGWHQNNTIGDTPQLNPWADNWGMFFAEHRIGYQLRLAQRRGGPFSQGATLLEAIPDLLADHHPQPSLVHGDLWSGNAAFAEGVPVILDPAVYYGDREVDIAMTELFGGFPRAFYEGYNKAWPLPEAYSKRKILYNLYHILNHFNLFGGSYAAQAERMIDQVLSRQ